MIKANWTGYFFYLRCSGFGAYEDGVVAGAYAGLLHFEDRPTLLWGFGGVANTETLLAHGLCHAHDHLSAEQEGDAEVKLQAWVSNRGLKTYLEKHVPKWIANGGVTSEGKIPSDFELWKQLYLRKQTSQLQIDRPQGRDALAFFRNLDKRAAKLAEEVHHSGSFRRREIVKQGEGEL